MISPLPAAPPSPMRLPKPPSFPLWPEHEFWAIEQLADAVAHIRGMFEDNGAGRLEAQMNAMLRQGRARWFASQAVRAANKGDAITDRALRAVAFELLFEKEKRDLTPAQLEVVSYYERVAKRPLAKRRPGRYGPRYVASQHRDLRFDPGGERVARGNRDPRARPLPLRMQSRVRRAETARHRPIGDDSPTENLAWRVWKICAGFPGF